MKNRHADQIERLLNIGTALSAQRKMSHLFDVIITEAMAIANCDAGTLYILENNMLHFTIMRNHTLKTYRGGKDDPVNLPPIAISETHVCAYTVIHRQLENIADVYTSDKFDFSGPKNYDRLTGYRTRSMLVVPLENNRGEVVGVVQLINALDDSGTVIPFDKSVEPIFRAVSAQAAIAVTNMRYMRENKELFRSFIEVFTTAIDERSPYNANHTKNVAMLVSGFIDFINDKHKSGETALFLDDALKEQVVMSAWLHDVGKIITPLEIMDKNTRLGNREDFVNLRFDLIYYAERVNFLEGRMTETAWEILSADIITAKNLITRLNSGAPTTDDELDYIIGLVGRVTKTHNGDIHWLEPAESSSLAIKYGTLTQDERKIMEAHAAITYRLLQKINFSREFADVPRFAAGHHEKLNGRGYPLGLSSSDIPLGTRILTVMDIFEALTASDRPYKKPMPLERALSILDDMAAKEEVDAELVVLVRQWQQQ